MTREISQSNLVLKVCSLTKKFGKFVAVSDMSFEVERGSFVSLLGPSGSGKTTILRLIAGFEAPSDGDIFLNNQRINDRRPFERDVSTVFQYYALFPHMSVFDNIAFGLQCRRLSAEELRKKVHHVLEMTHLSGKEERRIQTLSGGEQQRVALARSLVTNPSLLLLDEPLGALDLKLRREMAAELKRLHHRLNLTFLYVTHDQEEALSLSDQVIVMHEGTIRQVGTPIDLYWRPKTVFVADFLGGANVLTGRVVAAENGLLRIALGEELEPSIVSVAGEHGKIGDLASFALRGEKIAIGGDADAKDNRLTGVLEDIRFYGSLTEMEVRLETGQLLRVQRSSPTGASGHVVGDSVQLGWNGDEVVIITRD